MSSVDTIRVSTKLYALGVAIRDRVGTPGPRQIEIGDEKMPVGEPIPQDIGADGEPSVIVIDIPPFEQGSVSTIMQSVTQTLPNVILPAKAVPISVRCHGLTHTFTINIPSYTVILPSIIIRVPSQNIKLPAIDPPPVTVEVTQ